MNKKTLEKEEVEQRKKNMKVLKILLIIIDIIAGILLGVDIIFKMEINYYSYTVLFISNVVTFVLGSDKFIEKTR